MDTNIKIHKEEIRKKIRFNIIFSGVLHLTALIIFAIIGAAVYFLIKPTEGFFLRASIITAIVFISYIITTVTICRKYYRNLRRLNSKNKSK